MSKQQKALIAIIILTYSMLVIDVSIIITALPKIMADLHIDEALLTWIHNAYTIVFGGLLLLGSRLGDIFGKKKIYLTGVALFTFSSLMIGLSQNFKMLIFFRAIQGFGAAVLAPTIISFLSEYYEEGEDRNKATAFYGASGGVGSSVGMVLGGILADYWSWRVGFFINIPIGIILFLLSLKFLNKDKNKVSLKNFDYLGGLLSICGLGMTIYGIILSSEAHMPSFEVKASIGVGLSLTALFFLNEFFVKKPLLPLSVFTSNVRTGAYLSRFFFVGAMMGFLFFMSIFLQELLGKTPMETGFFFLPFTAATFISSMTVPRLMRKFGLSETLLSGLFIVILCMFWLSRFEEGANLSLSLYTPVIIMGFAQGLVLTPLTSAGIFKVQGQTSGAASGLVSVAHQVGGAFGVSILLVVFTKVKDSSSGDLLHMITSVFLGSTLFLGLSFLVILCTIHTHFNKESLS